jgi:hypothetical protein
VRNFEKHLGDLGKIDQFRSVNGSAPPPLGVAPIGLAQALLTFEIGSETYAEELEARGVTVTAEEQAAAVVKAKEFLDGPAGQSTAPSTWDQLSASTQRVFVDKVARQDKLVATLKSTTSDDELLAIYNSAKAPTSPPFEDVKDQILKEVVGQKFDSNFRTRVQSVTVDRRYGQFYRDTASFLSPEEEAEAQAAQAAQNGG